MSQQKENTSSYLRYAGENGAELAGNAFIVQSVTEKKSKSDFAYKVAPFKPTFKLEWPICRMTAPSMRDNKFSSGKKDYLSFVYYKPETITVGKKELKITQESFEKLDSARKNFLEALGTQLKPQAAKFKVKKTSQDDFESWVKGTQKRYPKKDDEFDLTATPYDAFKVTERTELIGPNKKVLKHSEVAGMDLICIPLVEYYSAYVNSTSGANIQSRLLSAIVLTVEPPAQRNEQLDRVGDVVDDELASEWDKKKLIASAAIKESEDKKKKEEKEEKTVKPKPKEKKEDKIKKINEKLEEPAEDEGEPEEKKDDGEEDNAEDATSNFLARIGKNKAK
jgi:hypothetical protein